MNGLSLKVRALSSEQGRTRKYSRNLVASDKDLLCSQKVMVTQKRSPSKKAESASLSYANPGRCFKASVHIFICRLDIRLRKNRSQKRSTDRRAEKAIEISGDAFILFLSISYLRKDRIEIPALRHRPGINESRIRFLLL